MAVDDDVTGNSEADDQLALLRSGESANGRRSPAVPPTERTAGRSLARRPASGLRARRYCRHRSKPCAARGSPAVVPASAPRTLGDVRTSSLVRWRPGSVRRVGTPVPWTMVSVRSRSAQRMRGRWRCISWTMVNANSPIQMGYGNYPGDIGEQANSRITNIPSNSPRTEVHGDNSRRH